MQRVLILGGGPAGMQAAVSFAEQGSEVLILEKEKELGGQVNLATIPPFKKELLNIVKFLINKIYLQKDRVRVLTSWNGDFSFITDWKPDIAIFAIGSVPFIPKIPGIEEAIERKFAVSSQEILSGNIEINKKRIVILGGGLIGCEIADFLVDKCQTVSIIEVLPELAADSFPWIKKILLGRLQNGKIQIFVGIKEEKIEKGKIEFIDQLGNKIKLETDIIVIAAGSSSKKENFPELKKLNVPIYEIGDCKKPRKILESIHEAYEVAISA